MWLAAVILGGGEFFDGAASGQARRERIQAALWRAQPIVHGRIALPRLGQHRPGRNAAVRPPDAPPPPGPFDSIGGIAIF